MRFYKNLEIFNTIQAIEASEFNDYDLPRHDSGGIFVSQSGETADIYKAVNFLYKLSIKFKLLVKSCKNSRNVHYGRCECCWLHDRYEC